ncbi:hypothetical protein DPMN_042753 [Dreissena polymorpha]|uniref:Uncharacterized protein n=1 Tax=Dreissena polymorpha TaxID=45954 RepID=A0A9D4D1D2_DREPO|nr:hypothetical protein DPMN_042753 [Dreissena polymorpha]
MHFMCTCQKCLYTSQRQRRHDSLICNCNFLFTCKANTAQLLFHFWEDAEVHRGQIRAVRRLTEALTPDYIYLKFRSLDQMRRCIIVV